MSIVAECLNKGSETESLNDSPSFRLTSETLYGTDTQNCTKDTVISFLAGFPVKPIRQPVMESELLETGGRKCLKLSASLNHPMYLPRMCHQQQLTLPHLTLSESVTRQNKPLCRRQTWVQTTYGSDIGYLHTPTATANYAAPSMQKWESCRNFVRVFGTPTPTNQEWMMGMPGNWTDLSPLGMHKFQQWQRQHGIYSQTEFSVYGDRPLPEWCYE